MSLHDTKQCGDSECERGGVDLPLSEFGVVYGRRSKRNLYCKDCMRRRVYASRKSFEAAGRKPCKRPGRYKPVAPSTVRIIQAIQKGFHSREGIKKATGMGWEPLVDSLADLLDKEILRSEVVNGERCFYEAA